ncbi:MAG: hypothetical protein ACD_54C01161G0001 [uncultured bacterium]|nr:MAG: hypothetical protein ACD_54C01161G0001 [uncultured bacterium]
MPCVRQPNQVANCIASGPGSSMQNDSAERYSFSLTHCFSSTNSRCIRAICAAGPPNDRMPMRAKVRVRSESEACVMTTSYANPERQCQRKPF